MYLLTFLGAYLQKWPGPVTSLRVELIMPSHYLFIIFHHKDTSHKRKHKKTRLITICNRKFTFLCRCYCVYFVILRPSFVFFFFNFYGFCFQGMRIPSYDNELLHLSEDLAKRLLPAFDTPTGNTICLLFF